jgi:integrase
MSTGRSTRLVPLSDAALKVLEDVPRIAGSDFVFAARRGGALSDMSLTQVMRRMEVDAVPHGFRSTFRDWAGERTNHAREVAEQALAHVIENEVEAAYRRGDALEKRRILMKEWAEFVDASDVVVSV